MKINKQQVNALLGEIVDLNTQQDLLTGNVVQDIDIHDDKVSITLEFHYPNLSEQERIEQEIKQKFETHGVRCDLQMRHKIISCSVQPNVSLIKNVKNTIAIASGKGGVGKSTLSTNLALALQAEGANVGILDADIYGPSQPRMLGCQGKPDSHDNKSIEPKVSYNMQSMSIGYLIAEDTPTIWRGPMVTNALEQLLRETNWVDIDYLIIDLPPGTGDIQLTLCQKIPVSGTLIVTTPQDIALIDAKKALKMFEKVNIPVLGLVENMANYVCPHCKHESYIFGEGGGAQMATQYDIELLGRLPLDLRIREGADNARPIVAMQPESSVAECYREIARRASAKLSLRKRDYSTAFPKIVVENK